MIPIKLSAKLYLIPLDQDLPGFTSFISSWLYKGKRNILIDVGPAATVSRLNQALGELDVTRPDVILLTHIHIDHAGGIGDLAQMFPDTPIVCHKSGLRHLIDPTRLWEGSLETLGKTARAYGPFRPVDSKVLQDAADFRAYGVEPVMTPGHAPHHVSYLIDGYLFGGEAAGVSIELPGGMRYLRPATPPRFFLETSIQSIDRLLEKKHDCLCYGHFGRTLATPKALREHREQLFLWMDLIQDEMKQGGDTNLVERCMERLLKTDPLVSGWKLLEPEVWEREAYFFRNSILGFIGYLDSRHSVDR